MSEAKHTPGPWEFEPDTGCIATADRLVGHPVAYVSGSRPERMENGHLIAAAPELLEALQLFVVLDGTASAITARTEVISDATWIEIFHEAITKAEAAIRKAKGQ
jgi:hypothetical protein